MDVKAMRSMIRSIMIGAACAVLTAATIVSAEVAVAAGPAATGGGRLVVADLPGQDNGGSIVEDGAYPGAGDIEATQHIRLISGDGHILLADCATTPVNDIGVMKVWTTDVIGPDGQGLVCFRVTASTGLLNLNVPAVYEIRGDGQRAGAGHKATAEVTTDAGVHTSVTVNPSGSTQVGIGTSPNADPTTLLQLKVTG
jgi:hypothetical protein